MKFFLMFVLILIALSSGCITSTEEQPQVVFCEEHGYNYYGYGIPNECWKIENDTIKTRMIGWFNRSLYWVEDS